jgi:hypothetical protein
MPPLRKLVRLADVKGELRDGDLLLFRRRGLIAIAGRGVHSHAAKLAWWGDEPFCVEVREWFGGRAVTLASQVVRYPGTIDLFRANPGGRWPEYDAAAATRYMRRLAGCDYGYAAVIDTLEEVTVERLAGGAEVETTAWRFLEEATDLATISGAVVRRDAVWHTLAGVVVAPGDAIVDAADNRWRVYQVNELRGTTRSVCLNRRTVLRESMLETFDLERPVWGEGSEGPEIVGWDVVEEDLSGVFVTDESIAESSAATRVTIFTAGAIGCEAGDRVRRHEGDRVYAIVSQSPPVTVGDVYRVTAEETAE